MAPIVCLIMLPLHFAAASSVQTLPPVTTADGRLGVCDVLAGTPPLVGAPSWAQMAYNAGARVDRWEIRWDQVEAQPNVWTFAAPDAAVQGARQVGLQVEGILIGTPAWAVAAGELPGNGLPAGLDLPVTDPGNLWAVYVRQTVDHYRGQIQDWEIWNEPDLPYFWSSTPQEYFQLLKVADQVIHTEEPGAAVIMAGMVAPDLTFFGQVLDAANHDPEARQNHGYFDIAAWHSYGAASLLYSNILHVKALLAAKGYGSIPLWVTEDGFPANNPNGEPRQAAYVLQTVAYAFAAGAAKVLIYRLSDDSEPKTWGLVSASGVPRMGYVALQVAARFLSQVQSVVYAPTPDAERFVFFEPTQLVTMLWSHTITGDHIVLPAGQPGAHLVNWQGAAQPLAAQQGQYQLTVPGAQYNAGIDPPGSVVGGPPDLLVENNTAPVTFASRTYLPPPPGNSPQVVLFNPATTPATAQIAAAALPQNRMVVQLAAHSLQSVDLALLTAAGYHQLYQVSATGQVTGQAVSAQVRETGLASSPTWYVTTAPATLTVTNTGAQAVNARLTAFGPKGVVRARQTLHLLPNAATTWSAPASLLPLSVVVQAGGPVVVGGTTPLRDIVAQAQTTWYAVHPHNAPLVIINPSGQQRVAIDARFVRSPVRGEQLRLAPHHSFVLPSNNANAVTISADHPVVVAYGAPAAVPLNSAAGQQTAFAEAGTATRAVFFNSSAQIAHVSVSEVGVGAAGPRTMTLKPSQVYTLRIRSPVAPARGVVVSSDVPIIAAPAG